MTPARDEREYTPIDIDYELQDMRQRERVQEALTAILVNTHPVEVMHGHDDYPAAVNSLRERVMYAEPWQRLSEVVMRGSLGDSATKDEMSVTVEYDPANRLESRIAEVIGELGEICQSPQPEDATKIKLLELDHILLTAQRPEESLDQKEFVTVALSGIEQVEQAVHDKYQVLMEQNGFAVLFNAEFEELEGKEVSVEEVMAVEKQAFDSLVTATYDVEELHELHELAVSMQEEIRLREQVLKIAQGIVPRETIAVQERIAEMIPVEASLMLAA